MKNSESSWGSHAAFRLSLKSIDSFSILGVWSLAPSGSTCLLFGNQNGDSQRSPSGNRKWWSFPVRTRLEVVNTQQIWERTSSTSPRKTKDKTAYLNWISTLYDWSRIFKSMLPSLKGTNKLSVAQFTGSLILFSHVDITSERIGGAEHKHFPLQSWRIHFNSNNSLTSVKKIRKLKFNRITAARFFNSRLRVQRQEPPNVFSWWNARRVLKESALRPFPFRADPLLNWLGKTFLPL